MYFKSATFGYELSLTIPDVWPIESYNPNFKMLLLLLQIHLAVERPRSALEFVEIVMVAVIGRIQNSLWGWCLTVSKSQKSISATPSKHPFIMYSYYTRWVEESQISDTNQRRSRYWGRSVILHKPIGPPIHLHRLYSDLFVPFALASDYWS